MTHFGRPGGPLMALLVLCVLDALGRPSAAEQAPGEVGQADTPKPIRGEIFCGSVTPDRRDLVQLMAQADAVLRVVVLDQGRPLVNGQPAVAGDRGGGIVSTTFQLRILEVIKGHHAAGLAGGEMTVVHPGGRVDMGDHVLMTQTCLPQVLSQGEELFGFFSYSPAREQWFIGSGTALAIRDGVVFLVGSPESSPAAAALTGLSSREVSDRLQTAFADSLAPRFRIFQGPVRLPSPPPAPPAPPPPLVAP